MTQVRYRTQTFPKKQGTFFRFDPPVLIIDATWHEKRATFAGQLHQQLAMAYVGYEDLVRTVDRCVHMVS